MTTDNNNSQAGVLNSSSMQLRTKFIIGSGLLFYFALLSGILVSFQENLKDKFIYHPIFMGLGLVLMAVGYIIPIGGKNERSADHNTSALVHLVVMILALSGFGIGWYMMYLKHEEAGVGHFGNEKLTGLDYIIHKVHVFGGYLILGLMIIQLLGGLAKYFQLPKKTTTWHGSLAFYIFTLASINVILGPWMLLKLWNIGYVVFLDLVLIFMGYNVIRGRKNPEELWGGSGSSGRGVGGDDGNTDQYFQDPECSSNGSNFGDVVGERYNDTAGRYNERSPLVVNRAGGGTSSHRD